MRAEKISGFTFNIQKKKHSLASETRNVNDKNDRDIEDNYDDDDDDDDDGNDSGAGGAAGGGATCLRLLEPSSV